MAEEVSIRVNFAKPVPVFPLDQVALLPQQIVPLHIFEPRYRQMIDHALDGPGQIAMAKFDGRAWKQQYHGNPRLRPAVCIGQIVEHEKLPDGRYNIVLQGVCRARIVEEKMPDSEIMYRRALLEPIGFDEDDDAGTVPAESFRAWLTENLTDGPLSRLGDAENLLNLASNEQFPAQVIVDVVSFAMINEDRTRYRLLEEASASKRIDLVRGYLEDLASLIRKAVAQKPGDWPKGCAWN